MTLFRRIEYHQTQDTSSLTREVRDDKGEKTTEKKIRAGSRGDVEFFFRGVHH